MTQASGSNARIIYDQETTFATTPVSPDAKILPFTNEGLGQKTELMRSNVIRSTRNPSMPSRGNRDVSGNIATHKTVTTDEDTAAPIAPGEKPEIRTRSLKQEGCVSSIICRVKLVRNSGIPNVPDVAPSSSGVNPNAFVEEKILRVAGSSKGIDCGSRWVKSSSILITVGSSCPKISSLTNRLLIE